MHAFLYDAHLAPARLERVAPGARFICPAHLPESRLVFVLDGGIPSLVPHEGESVWGAMFEVPKGDMKTLVASQRDEGRELRNGYRPVDRDGNVYDAITFVAESASSDVDPATNYLAEVVEGGRHWGLPFGWLIGLEELAGRA